jgi:DNA-binding transcriptional ArsR family regulator
MAVAEPSRWRIVRLLGRGTRSVTQLAEETGLSVAATCRHVQRLRAVGVVQADRRGKELLCRPADPESTVGRWLAGLLRGGTWYRRLAGAGAASPEIPPEAPPRTGPRSGAAPAGKPGRTPRPGRAPTRGPSHAPADTPARAAPVSEPAPPRPSRDIEDFLL